MNRLGARSRPEIALLLSCSRPRIDSEHADRIKELGQNNIEWDYLLKLAGHHGPIPGPEGSFQHDVYFQAWSG